MSGPVQVRRDNDDSPFILDGNPIESIDGVIGQDGGRSTPLLFGTLLAKISSNGFFTPFIDETATNGTALPGPIYLGPDIAAADIVAGNVVGVHILLSDAEFDEDRLVIEAGKTLETIISQGTKDQRTVRDHLLNLGLVPRLTENVNNFEN